MAAPYCTITGTIPGGENGKAIVRIIPDVAGAQALVGEHFVNIGETTLYTQSDGSIRGSVIAPGNGVIPAGGWTYKVIIDGPKLDIIKHVQFEQGGTVDIMAAPPVKEVAPDVFGGGRGPVGPPGPRGPRGPAGSGGGTPLSALPLQAGRLVPTVGFFGDSWSAESTMGAGSTIPAAASRVLGCVPVVSAVNGSGFAYSASGKDGFEVDDRVNFVTSAVPNLIVTVGSLNSDKKVSNGDANGETIKQAVQDFVHKVRAKLPNVPIIMVGPEPSSVARLLSSSAHINVAAQKAGWEAVGGLSAGVAFVDWLGIADKQAVPWSDGRICAENDVVVYNGVAYRVTRPWAPAPGANPTTKDAPVVQVSDVLSGTGNVANPKGDGTRDNLILADDTHPTTIGGVAFAAALANRITTALEDLSAWIDAAGPVTTATPDAPPPQPPKPRGDGLPVMAWLPDGWGQSDRQWFTNDDIKSIIALKPDQVALPVQVTLDTADGAIAIPYKIKPTPQAPKEIDITDLTLTGIRNQGINAAGFVESMDLIEAAGIEVLPNIRNGLLDSQAEWYKNRDGKMFNLLKTRGKKYQEIHGRGQSKLREIMAKEYPDFVRVVEASAASADWMITDGVKFGQKAIISTAKANPEVWRASKNAFPDGVWVLITSNDDKVTAKQMSETSGVKIIGWAVGSPEALAEIRK